MMAENSRKTVVCSWNEWDPLKHVIVGRASGTMIQAPEPAVQNDWPQQGFPLGSYREQLPWHIDATLIPLRPGLVLVNPERTPLQKAHDALFEQNGWELVEAPKSVRTEKMPLCTCSLWLNINCLVLDPKTICIEAAETPMMKLLDKYGFEVIPVPLFEVSPFGGGLHCATADVYREGSLEDYFPRQIDGF